MQVPVMICMLPYGVCRHFCGVADESMMQHCSKKPWGYSLAETCSKWSPAYCRSPHATL